MGTGVWYRGLEMFWFVVELVDEVEGDVVELDDEVEDDVVELVDEVEDDVEELFG